MRDRRTERITCRGVTSESPTARDARTGGLMPCQDKALVQTTMRYAT